MCRPTVSVKAQSPLFCDKCPFSSRSLDLLWRHSCPKPFSELLRKKAACWDSSDSWATVMKSDGCTMTSEKSLNYKDFNRISQLGFDFRNLVLMKRLRRLLFIFSDQNQTVEYNLRTCCHFKTQTEFTISQRVIFKIFTWKAFFSTYGEYVFICF